MIPIQEEGEFKAKIYSYGTRESQKQGSNSMAMTISAVLTHKRDPLKNEWIEITEPVYGAEGEIYYIRANGDEDVTKVESLMQATGWDGKTTTLDQVDQDSFLPLPEEKRWKPAECIAVIKEDTYLRDAGKGGVRYRIDQLRPLDASAPRVVTETGARRRAAKAAVAKAKAIGVTAPPYVPPPEPSSNDVPLTGPDGEVIF